MGDLATVEASARPSAQIAEEGSPSTSAMPSQGTEAVLEILLGLAPEENRLLLRDALEELRVIDSILEQGRFEPAAASSDVVQETILTLMRFTNSLVGHIVTVSVSSPHVTEIEEEHGKNGLMKLLGRTLNELLGTPMAVEEEKFGWVRCAVQSCFTKSDIWFGPIYQLWQHYTTTIRLDGTWKEVFTVNLCELMTHFLYAGLCGDKARVEFLRPVVRQMLRTPILGELAQPWGWNGWIILVA